MAILKKNIRLILLILIFLVIIIPLIVNPSLTFPFIVGKNLLFRFLIQAAFSLWCFLAIIDKSYRPVRSNILFSLFAFLIIMGIANMAGENPYRSFWSTMERMQGYITLLHLVALFLIASTTFSNKKQWYLFFNITIAVSTVVSIWGLYKIGSTVLGVESTFGNRSYFGSYILFHIFILIHMFLSERRRPIKFAYITIIIFQTYMLYLSGNRGGMLGLISGLTIAFALIFILWNRKKTALKIVITIGVCFLLFYSFAKMKDSDFFKHDRILARFSKTFSEDFRFELWKICLIGLQENPLLGAGQENFNILYNKNYQYQFYNVDEWFDDPHNVLINNFTSGGLLGGFAYLAIIFFLISGIWRNKKFTLGNKTILTGLVVSYLVRNMFIFDTISSSFQFFIILAYIQNMNLSPTEATIHQEKKKKIIKKNFHPPVPGYKYAAISLIIILSTASIYYTVIREYQLYRSFYDITHTPAKTLEWRFEKTRNYFESSPFYVNFTRILFPRFLKFIVHNKNIEKHQKEKFIRIAINELMLLVREQPNQTKYQYIAARIFSTYGLHQKAIFHIEKALKLSPKKQPIMIQHGVCYFKMAMAKKSKPLMEKAVQLLENIHTIVTGPKKHSHPKWRKTAIHYYAQALMALGKNELAKKILGDDYKSSLKKRAFIEARAFFKHP